MAKYELYLIDLFNSQKVSIDKTSTTEGGKTFDCIEMVFYDTKKDNEICHSLYLDKSTAIKFSKALRTEINKIED